MLDSRGQPHGAEGAEHAGMVLPVGLWDLCLRDRGRQRHPQPGRRAPIQGVVRGQGGEGGSAALPPLPRIVDGPPVAGRRGALAEAGRGGNRRGGRRGVRGGLVVQRRPPRFRGQRRILGGRGLATARGGLHPPVRIHRAGGAPGRPLVEAGKQPLRPCY